MIGKNIRLIWSRKKAFCQMSDRNAWRATRIQLCTSFQLDLMYTACHGLRRKPHVKYHFELLSQAHRKAHCINDIWQAWWWFFCFSGQLVQSLDKPAQIVHKEPRGCQNHHYKAVTRMLLLMNTSHFHVANVSTTKMSREADTKLLGMEENF